MINSLKTIYLLAEELHPELKSIIEKPHSDEVNKHEAIVNKVNELHRTGTSSGLDGNIPKGSSRAYLKHKDGFPVNINGKSQTIQTGTKVAIRNRNDEYHDKTKYGHVSFGAMQNAVENPDNPEHDKKYRVLHQDDKGNWHHNPDGIFPPLIKADHKNHEWAHIGHARDVSESEFKNLTKTESHPEGISHTDFVDTLLRRHDIDRGKHHPMSDKTEKHMDHVESHPMVQKFIRHQREHGSHPNDYILENMGSFHANGKDHLVARDHGYNDDVGRAYNDARKKDPANAWAHKLYAAASD